jgi:hypothetical protein
MFTSHVILVGDSVLSKVLTPEIVRAIRKKIEDDASFEELETCYLLENLAGGKELPDQKTLQAGHPNGKRWFRPDYTSAQLALITTFRFKLNGPQTAETPVTTKCRICGKSPFDAYIISCMHVLCLECFGSANATTDAAEEGLKCGCGSAVKEWAFFPTIESLQTTLPTIPEPGTDSPGNAVQPVRPAIGWLGSAGHLMQGAKLQAVRHCILNWVQSNPKVKIVVFTQFLGMVHILSGLCQTEGWGYKTVRASSLLVDGWQMVLTDMSCTFQSLRARRIL